MGLNWKVFRQGVQSSLWAPSTSTSASTSAHTASHGLFLPSVARGKWGRGQKMSVLAVSPFLPAE